MGPPVVSNCLICGSDCTPPKGIAKKLNIPGAGNCSSLNVQLEQLFVVKILLGIEGNFLEEKLPFVGHLKWFKLCQKCRKLEVKPAWDAYQRMVAAQAKLAEIRKRVKEEMEETIWRKLKKHRDWGGAVGKRMDAEIRKILFPEMLGVKKNPGTTSLVPNNELFPDQVEEQSGRPRPSYNVEGMEVEETDLHSTDMDWEPPMDAEENNLDDDEDFDPQSESRSSSNRQSRPQSRSSSALSNALRRVRRKRNRKRKPRPIDQIKRFKCNDCGCYFNTHPQLVSHMEAHQRSKDAGGGPFDCPKCTFPAATEEELDTHTKNRHVRVKYHRCPKCEFKAKNWGAMREHLIKEHPDIAEEKASEVYLKCPVCQRQFAHKPQWMIHQRKMHPELFEGPIEQPVECTDCGQRFLSKRLLKYHVNSVHRTRPTKYVCEECGMGFLWPKKLEMHMITHTGKTNRNFICHLCGIDYAHQSLLTEHYKKVHPDEAEEGGTRRDPENKEEFKCRYCDLTSPYKVVITRHLRVHKEQRGYKCEECGNCYINEQGLKRHIRMNHSKIDTNTRCPFCRKVFPNADYMRGHVRVYCRLKGVVNPEPEPSIVLEEETGGEAVPMEPKSEAMFVNQVLSESQGQVVDEYGNNMDMKVVFQYD